MTKLTPLQCGWQKMVQNFFVMKSNTSLGAKAENSNKPTSPKSLSPEAGRAALWRKISLLGAFPTIGLVGVLVFLSIKNQPEKERPSFVKYEYMRIRNKRFPWGDGNKTFFHNPRVNALPEGYEE